MLGFYNYTVWLTYLSLLSGGVGICMAFLNHPLIAVLCLIISGICDMFDGTIARTKKDRTHEEKVYGIQIDSLSDLICFGVLPVVIGYSIGLNQLYIIPVYALFILFGMIRLSYYNVLELGRMKKNEEGEDGVIEIEEDKVKKEKKKYFIGLPITTSAIVMPLLFLLWNIVSVDNFRWIYLAFLSFIGIMYVIKIKIPKPNFVVSIIFTILGVILIGALIFLNIKNM